LLKAVENPPFERFAPPPDVCYNAIKEAPPIGGRPKKTEKGLAAYLATGAAISFCCACSGRVACSESQLLASG